MSLFFKISELFLVLGNWLPALVGLWQVVSVSQDFCTTRLPWAPVCLRKIAPASTTTSSIRQEMSQYGMSLVKPSDGKSLFDHRSTNICLWGKDYYSVVTVWLSTHGSRCFQTPWNKTVLFSKALEALKAGFIDSRSFFSYVTDRCKLQLHATCVDCFMRLPGHSNLLEWFKTNGRTTSTARMFVEIRVREWRISVMFADLGCAASTFSKLDAYKRRKL